MVENAIFLIGGALIGAMVGGTATIIAANIRARRNEKLKEISLRNKEIEKKYLSIYQLYKDLVDAYNSTKRLRRVLRATAIRFMEESQGVKIKGVLRHPYDEQMEQLIDTQLHLEFYARYVESNLHVLDDIQSITPYLKTASKYLSNIVSEYEESWSVFSGEPSICPISKLPGLEDFLLPYKEARNYYEKFRKPYEKMLGELEKVSLEMK